jgi:A/G-specific adenine glycosylase
VTQHERITIFCAEMWQWFSVHKRTLPWRDLQMKDQNQKAYLVLVSEIMLQQTQVSRVITLYKNFIHQFPHLKALSNASNKEILIAWRGLGYNSRALRLRDAAKTIMEKFNGQFPSSMEDLLSIKGIGHYSAGAIRNFAFKLPTPCMDVNIRRILHRFFYGVENPDGTWKKSDKELLKLDAEVLNVALSMEKGSCADWYAALMDFGSLVCTKNNPKWELLSPGLRKVCKSYGKKIQKVSKEKKEPGRMMAGKFIPNRIFRGKIVEALRDAKKPLSVQKIGETAIADWPVRQEREWLVTLLEKLAKDSLIEKTAKQHYRLKIT